MAVSLDKKVPVSLVKRPHHIGAIGPNFRKER